MNYGVYFAFGRSGAVSSGLRILPSALLLTSEDLHGRDRPCQACLTPVRQVWNPAQFSVNQGKSPSARGGVRGRARQNVTTNRSQSQGVKLVCPVLETLPSLEQEELMGCHPYERFHSHLQPQKSWSHNWSCLQTEGRLFLFLSVASKTFFL
jgi:hypothetical protein